MHTDPVQDKCFYIIGWVLLVITGGILAAAYFGLFDRLGGLPPCMIHRLTGLYCPGCGGTRAVTALLQGHLLKSLFYHPIVGYTAAVGGWFMVSQTIARVSRGRFAIGMHYRDIYLWIALALVVVNCIAKNLVLVLGGIALMA
ncbi:MAG: DUF2752 domain-containing protein [Muribaculaceae bacterium]|nr:DUF2752 domain-containing protein [Roseburia sp.]MCM1432235.1 DUF2752 domain-containing protein [Muribaculaceae bacterium]MCM1491988.1 DUF2752 domain-containing protein [Muribaculaceae bacterium]